MPRCHLVAIVERECQTLTRALYHYASHRGVRFDEVHVLTSRLGFENVMHQLLGAAEHPGNFERLLAQVGLARGAVRFDASCIHTLPSPGGGTIADLRDCGDPVDVADQVLTVARKLSTGSDELFVTAEPVGLGIVAGVVTVLQLALQCRGRFCDIGVHPLVAFEIARGTVEDFYYPRGDIQIHGFVVAADDVLVVRELPFIAARPRRQGPEGDSLASMLCIEERLARWSVQPDPVEFDLGGRQVRIGGAPLPLAPVQLFWYAVIAARGGTRLHPDELAALHAGGLSTTPALALMHDVHRAIFRRPDGMEDVLRLAASSRGYLASVVSRLNSVLRAKVRPHAGPYLVRGGRNNGGYWLQLDPSQVRFVGGAPRAERGSSEGADPAIAVEGMV